MNLLTDNWIPVRDQALFKQVSLTEVLCQKRDFKLSLPRDDLELGALQLLVSITQVLWMPKNADELRRRINTPLTTEEYQLGIKDRMEWFDLEHPEIPFMQIRGVNAKEPTSIQKLFVGLPEGNNHAFFNQTGEVKSACSSCTTIAIFNEAQIAPGIGGGFKAPIRGSSPVSTLLKGEYLRDTIWMNVLQEKWVVKQLPWFGSAEEQPVWIKRIKADSKLKAHQIGLLRGLFWQPAHIEMGKHKETICSVCGTKGIGFSEYNKERFVYTLEGLWPHPYSPRVWEIKKDVKEGERFLSFTTTAPSWTRLTEMMVEKEGKKQGMQPAAVVSQYEKNLTDIPFFLTVGGYRNKQANILERRHEGFSIKQGWQNDKNRLAKFIERGLEIKTLLRRKSFSFGKSIGVKGVANETVTKFFAATESLVLKVLREMDWRDADLELQAFTEKASKAAKKVFDEVTLPYNHDVRMVRHLVRSRNSLHRELSYLTNPETNLTKGSG